MKLLTEKWKLHPSMKCLHEVYLSNQNLQKNIVKNIAISLTNNIAKNLAIIFLKIGIFS